MCLGIIAKSGEGRLELSIKPTLLIYFMTALLSLFSYLLLPYSSVTLSSFILVVSMRKCWGQRSCMSSTSILNVLHFSFCEKSEKFYKCKCVQIESKISSNVGKLSVDDPRQLMTALVQQDPGDSQLELAPTSQLPAARDSLFELALTSPQLPDAHVSQDTLSRSLLDAQLQVARLQETLETTRNDLEETQHHLQEALETSAATQCEREQLQEQLQDCQDKLHCSKEQLLNAQNSLTVERSHREQLAAQLDELTEQFRGQQTEVRVSRALCCCTRLASYIHTYAYTGCARYLRTNLYTLRKMLDIRQKCIHVFICVIYGYH